MSLLLACMINRADLLGEALLEEREALAPVLPDGAGGCGAGFYQAGEVLLRKRPRPIDGKVDWAGVLDGVRSDLVVAHVRDREQSSTSADDTQPFRMRQWLMAHVGEIAAANAMRDRLLSSLPDFVRRNVRGESDSELLFHVLLSFLHDGGQLDTLDASDAAVVSALRSTATLIDRHARELGAPAPGLTLVLENGRQLYAMRRGAPLWIVERERLAGRDSGAPRNGTPAGAMHYVLVTSGSDDNPPPGYRALDDREVVCIDRQLQVRSEGL
ncbi:MAG: class II glutamine amidotransferase [Myxococcales bacterium]|jgi:glutamine amidotransferase